MPGLDAAPPSDYIPLRWRCAFGTGAVRIDAPGAVPSAAMCYITAMPMHCRSEISLRLLLVVSLGLLCAGCGMALQEPPSPAVAEPPAAASSPPAHQELRELTESEKIILADGFASGLNDPESVRFRWAKVPKNLGGAGTTSFDYCGLVEVKGSNGRSNGMQPFLAAVTVASGAINGGAIAALNTDNRPENRDVIPKLCKQKGLDPASAK